MPLRLFIGMILCLLLAVSLNCYGQEMTYTIDLEDKRVTVEDLSYLVEPVTTPRDIEKIGQKEGWKHSKESFLMGEITSGKTRVFMRAKIQVKKAMPITVEYPWAHPIAFFHLQVIDTRGQVWKGREVRARTAMENFFWRVENLLMDGGT